MVSFENFVKSMPPSLSELKVTPSFCFPFKIHDDPTATSKYVVIVSPFSVKLQCGTAGTLLWLIFVKVLLVFDKDKYLGISFLLLILRTRQHQIPGKTMLNIKVIKKSCQITT